MEMGSSTPASMATTPASTTSTTTPRRPVPDVPPVLDDSLGPTEIQAVNRAFNRMTSQLQQSQRDRALLLAGVSHDLRTPLTRLRLSAEFLNDEEMSQGIIADIEDMDAILDQFISFIRDGADEQPEIVHSAGMDPPGRAVQSHATGTGDSSLNTTIATSSKSPHVGFDSNTRGRSHGRERGSPR